MIKEIIQKFIDGLIKFGHKIKEAIEMAIEHFYEYRITFNSKGVIKEVSEY